MKLVVFAICSGIGYLLGQYLPAPWATYVSILVSYHLFLGWLVITADHDAGFSMPVLHTLVTHAACLAVLIGLAMGRRYIPFLGLVRMFVPGLAPFECDWLFSGGRVKKAVPKETDDGHIVAATTMDTASEAPTVSEIVATGESSNTNVVAAAPAGEYTADEHTAWIQYLRNPRRAFRKPGVSVEEEFKLWQAARAQYKALLAQNQTPD
jgi:hypothetical protein